MIKKRLKNGVTLVFEGRKTDSIALEVQIEVGSVNESRKQAGMTHLIEHMLFEGTQIRSARDISNAIESVGGEFNAATTHERTFYYIHLPRKYFGRAVEIMADIIKNPLFNEKTLRKEKNVVLNEIKVTDDDPKSYLWIVFLKTLFQKHRARNPIYGNAQAIKKMTRRGIIAYYKRHYVPKRMVVSLVGDVRNPLYLLEKHFGALPPSPSRKEHVQQEPPSRKQKRSVTRRDVEHVYLAIGYPAPSKTNRDVYAMEVIRSILGRGQSSRLFDEIRTKRGIAYMVGAAYEASLTFGAFVSYISTDKKNLQEARRVLLAAFQLKDLAQQEVEDAKNYLIGNFIVRNEDSKNRADTNAEYALVKKDSKEYTKAIKRVTLQDVKRVAKKYFHKNYAEALIRR